MIQRIQTIYLILVSALMAVLLFVPFATLSNDTDTYLFSAEGLTVPSDGNPLIYETWAILGLLIIITLLPLITIFLYKRRKLQMRWCLYNGILILAFYLLFFSYWWILKGDLQVSTSFTSYLLLPLLALYFDYRAFRRILQDDLLVRSLDRIR